jgi:hypothetical protein
LRIVVVIVEEVVDHEDSEGEGEESEPEIKHFVEFSHVEVDVGSSDTEEG